MALIVASSASKISDDTSITAAPSMIGTDSEIRVVPSGNAVVMAPVMPAEGPPISPLTICVTMFDGSDDLSVITQRSSDTSRWSGLKK